MHLIDLEKGKDFGWLVLYRLKKSFLELRLLGLFEERKSEVVEEEGEAIVSMAKETCREKECMR